MGDMEIGFGGRVCPPIDIHSVPKNFLFAFEPECHVYKFVLSVRGFVGVLGELDVEAFSGLGIVVIRCAEKLNEVSVVAGIVKFRELEMRSNSEVNKDLFIRMKLG